jgi:6-phosphogluconolactonase
VATEDPNGVNPLPRLTLTLPAIDQAHRIVFTVSGPEKRQAIERLGAGDDIPAARVRAPQIDWLVDAEALGAPS